MSRERVQTRCDPDTIEQIERFTDEKEISESEAVRRLVRTGLIQKGYREPDTSGLAVAKQSARMRLVGGLLIGLAILGLVIQFII
ncbi:hypothetical protein [Halobellus sp. EA9]|uniref:hypothetical protein n=1 Tax=Halobellus sp. EA9 TaxID=3421647 RepID=UPI003EBF8F41